MYLNERDRPWRLTRETIEASRRCTVRQVPERVKYGERAFVEKFVTFFKDGAFSIW